MIYGILSRNYLKERRKVSLLVSIAPFPLVILMTWSISLLLSRSHLSGIHSLFISIISMGTISLLLISPLIALGEDDLIAAFCIVVQVYVDWYLGARYVALGLILIAFLVRYLTRSPQQTWTFPRMQGLWLLLLVLAIFPALRGYTLSEGITYYLTNFFAAFLAFWLGNTLAQDIARVQRFFSILAAFGALLALISLIQSLTGKLLFYSSIHDPFISQMGNFALFVGSSTHRVGGLLVDPDWNGAFCAMVIFLPLSLFLGDSTPQMKALNLIEGALILLALLVTYTTTAWIGAIIALLIFLTLLGSMRSRLIFFGLIITGLAVFIIFFHTQIFHQLQHATTRSDLMIRINAWQNGFRVIGALPLTGLGLGLHRYLYRSPVYYVTGRWYRVLAHPLNSYLEIGDLGGLPLLIIFLALLVLGVWWTLSNWRQSETRTRTLIAGGIALVVSLSVSSIGNNGWTVAPLAIPGWMTLGVISSAFLTTHYPRAAKQKTMQEL